MSVRSTLFNTDSIGEAQTRTSMRPAAMLLVGAGQRIESTVLPALACLPDEFEIVGIYSRSQDKLDRLHALWQVPVSTDLEVFDWNAINFIYVAVTLQNVPDVLVTLTANPTSQIRLILDTPVLAKGHLDYIHLFRAFQDVFVAEDCIALPQLDVAQQLLASGAIGRPQKLWMFHSGYSYHAIAMARSLVGRAPVVSGRSRRYGRDGGEIYLRFASGFEETVVQPRDYRVGSFLLMGSEGAIADYPLSTENAHVIQYQMDDERWTGLTVNGKKWPKHERDRSFDTLALSSLSERSLMTQLKIRGLVTVLADLQADKHARSYPVREGIYDSMLCYTLGVLPSWIDAFALWGASGMTYFS